MRQVTYDCHAGLKSQPPGYSFESPDYEHFQVIFVRQGNLYFAAENRIKALGPGELILLRLGGAFKLSCGNVGYSGVFFAAYENDPLALSGPPLALTAPPPLVTLAEMIEHEAGQPGPATREVLTALGRALAWKALRLSEAAVHRRESVDYASYWAESARQALEAALLTGRSAREVLGSLGLSYRQVARHFCQVFGVSPKQYQIQARVRYAQQLLETTDLPVTAIAYELHFSSSQHFATQFSRKTGQSPSAFRAARRAAASPK